MIIFSRFNTKRIRSSLNLNLNWTLENPKPVSSDEPFRGSEKKNDVIEQATWKLEAEQARLSRGIVANLIDGPKSIVGSPLLLLSHLLALVKS